MPPRKKLRTVSHVISDASLRSLTQSNNAEDVPTYETPPPPAYEAIFGTSVHGAYNSEEILKTTHRTSQAESLRAIGFMGKQSAGFQNHLTREQTKEQSLRLKKEMAIVEIAVVFEQLKLLHPCTAIALKKEFESRTAGEYDVLVRLITLLQNTAGMNETLAQSRKNIDEYETKLQELTRKKVRLLPVYLCVLLYFRRLISRIWYVDSRLHSKRS